MSEICFQIIMGFIASSTLLLPLYALLSPNIKIVRDVSYHDQKGSIEDYLEELAEGRVEWSKPFVSVDALLTLAGSLALTFILGLIILIVVIMRGADINPNWLLTCSFFMSFPPAAGLMIDYFEKQKLSLTSRSKDAIAMNRREYFVNDILKGSVYVQTTIKQR